MRKIKEIYAGIVQMVFPLIEIHKFNEKLLKISIIFLPFLKLFRISEKMGI